MNNTTNNLVQALFYQRENDLLHLPYNNELAFYEAVKNGDMDKVKKLMLPLTSTGLGHLSDNPSRNLKYHFIITTAFITRFCIEGGMDTELAYTISDLYIQRVDVCNSCEEIKNMHKEMVYDLTNRMHSLKYKNIYTKKVVICIDHINANLRVISGLLYFS